MRQIQLFIKHDSAKIINLAYFCRLYLRLLTFSEICIHSKGNGFN